MKLIRVSVVTLAAGLMTLPAASIANAQSDRAAQLQARIMAGVKKLEAGCGDDARKFCSSVTPGDGRLFFCILAHEDKLSTKCDYALFEASRNLERALDRVELAADACWNDIEKQCANIPEGGGRIMQCLAGKKASLSAACRTAIDNIVLK